MARDGKTTMPWVAKEMTMNVETITMEPEVARQAFRDYRAAVKLNRDDRRRREDEQMAAAYKAASKGLAVLDLHHVMKQAGVLESGYPVLAIAKADLEHIRVDMHQDGGAVFHDVAMASYRRSRRRVAFPTDTFPRWTWSDRVNRWRSGTTALVPTIPPALRPKHALSGYHILWEAVWEPAPPVDPLLLKHLGGALYAVLAAWDLTKIEQAVLRGRLQS
jgi:hypothetical protein